MRHEIALLLIVLQMLCVPAVTVAEDISSEDWMQLLRSEDYDGAQALCEEWAESNDKMRKAEAYKCFANLALINASIVYVERAGEGGVLRDGYKQDAADKAIGFLEKAIEISPEDLSIHQGRLHVLLMSGRYYDTADALKDSLKRYSGEDALESWLAYSPRFFNIGQYDAGVKFLKVLEKQYPDEHRIKANIGAFLSMLERDEEALKYSKKAVELKPDDPLNNWNLGRLYDYMNDIENADRYYVRALELWEGREDASASYCVYAEFVKEKLEQNERACDIFREHCPDEYDVNCK